MNDKLISADALYQEVIGSREDNRQTESMAQAMHKYLHNHFLTMIYHAPAADAVEKEKYNELREAFVDFVCSGIHNPAPWCKNRNEECTNVYGMCVFSNDACRGFNPDGERREDNEID